MLRIIYMGTPHFAVPALEALLANRAPDTLLPDGYEIVTVITRPDKPVGRGKELAFSPVKQAALDHAIPVWQPGSLKRPETIEALGAYQADLYIVAAFGQSGQAAAHVLRGAVRPTLFALAPSPIPPPRRAIGLCAWLCARVYGQGGIAAPQAVQS